MSLIADALQPQIVRELFSLRGRPVIRHMSEMVLNGPKAGYDLDADPVLKEVRIDFREKAFIAEGIGGDAARLAAACFASMAELPQSIENGVQLPWSLVRMYYAAFYAGHSILRIHGRSCTYFEAKHTGRIKSLLMAVGNPLPFDLPSGLYHCSLNADQTGFSMKQTGGRVGGAHETFWEIFDGFLSELNDNILGAHMREQDARDVLAKIEAARRILRRGSGASWLSWVRNEIQYRQGLGVWTPLTVNRSRRAALSRLAAQWVRDPMAIDVDAHPNGELAAFVAACAFLTGMCRTVFDRVSQRSDAAANSFARIPLILNK